MKRLQRIAAEIFAIVAIWALWNWRIAATLAVLLVVVRALQEDRPGPRQAAPGEPPTLRNPAAGASPSSRQSPGSGNIQS